jgi:excinuclease UvrABC nuclease subunit
MKQPLSAFSNEWQAPMIADLFPQSSPITPAAPEAERVDFAAIPAKAALYLLTTATEAAADHPVLLATVGDLRAALKRRLADNPPDTKTKRVAYGQLCTRVHYRIVYSAWAANFHYAQAARALFPRTAEALIPWRTSWWIAVERAGPFPRFRKTNILSDPGLAYAGPIRDKHAAQRLVESLEDLFDLCRYHHILVQAPHGKACAYKEMGKCPAPCDGSESLAAYRARIDAALAFATDRPAPRAGAPAAGPESTGAPVASARAAWRARLENQMQAAAAALRFETAGKIKQRLARAGLLETEPFGVTAALEDFAFLTLQPGQGKPWIEPWIVHFRGARAIQPLPQFHVRELAATARHLADQCRLLDQVGAPAFLTAEQARDAALAAHHLCKGESDHGIWLRLRAAQDPAAVVRAAEILRARQAPKPLAEQSTDAAPEAGESVEAAPE